MSNIKYIEIEARMPYDWASKLPESEAAHIAGLLLNPVIGVHLEQNELGYHPNENGGMTAMYSVRINGAEALSYPYLERLVKALASVGDVSRAEATDVQWPDENNAPVDLTSP